MKGEIEEALEDIIAELYQKKFGIGLTKIPLSTLRKDDIVMSGGTVVSLPVLLPDGQYEYKIESEHFSIPIPQFTASKNIWIRTRSVITETKLV